MPKPETNSPDQFTEGYFNKMAGWEAVQTAKALSACGKVLSAEWAAPLLRGIVQEGGMTYKAGLVIRSEVDVENLCSCRDSRQWGKICSHSVALGLHLNRSRTVVSFPAGFPAAPASKPPGPVRSQVARKRILQSSEGIEASVTVVFPPNLLPALLKEKVMLLFEVEAGSKRVPLNNLPLDRQYAFPAEDIPLVEALEHFSPGEIPGMAVFSSRQLEQLLPLLCQHPRLSLGRNKPLTVTSEPVRLRIKATLEPSGEILLKLDQPPPVLIPGTSWSFSESGPGFAPLRLTPSTQTICSQPVRIQREKIPAFLMSEFSALEKCAHFASDFSAEDFEMETLEPKFSAHFLGGLAILELELKADYKGQSFCLGVDKADLWMPDSVRPKVYSTRNTATENAALNLFLRHGFSGPNEQKRYVLKGQNEVLNFFARVYSRLPADWKVTLEERLEKSRANNIETIQPRFQVIPSGEQWFELEVDYRTQNGERFSPADIQRLLLSGQSHTRLKSGKIALFDSEALDEFQQALRDSNPRQEGNKFKLSNIQGAFLETTVRETAGWNLSAPAGWKEKISGKASAVGKIDLGDLEPVLRPYQKEGVSWMSFLRQNRFGGILADEMGLGKTVQTLAFIRTIRAGQSSTLGAGGIPPTLIVCPTSLVFNWMDEARKWTPQLKVLNLTGGGRSELFGQIEKHDLVITSYGLIRRDAQLYQQLQFDTVVLDEAQHIKNRQTQNAQAVKAIRAQNRLVLTGTPLENSVLDLWSIFDFLMPGYLGTAQDFRERYEVPISRENDRQVQARLSRRLRPFLLRRLKKDVAADLPEKIEQVSFCELTEEQSQVYREILSATRKELSDAVGQQGLEKSRLLILNALTRLRQICCDLRLLKLEKVEEHFASGKLELFSELLEEVVDGGHRVLVFSQFVEMLSLLKKRLDRDQIKYSYLDGSTTQRGAVVQEFQGNDQIPVFLISLKAGGVGLNLTAADTVIHFDPWWNPAVEQQATDRAHRIGQKKIVTSYKLIARGTVEEKILHLQNKKKGMINNIIDGEEGFSKSLSWDDVQDLLA